MGQKQGGEGEHTAVTPAHRGTGYPARGQAPGTLRVVPGQVPSRDPEELTSNQGKGQTSSRRHTFKSHTHPDCGWCASNPQTGVRRVGRRSKPPHTCLKVRNVRTERTVSLRGASEGGLHLAGRRPPVPRHCRLPGLQARCEQGDRHGPAQQEGTPAPPRLLNFLWPERWRPGPRRLPRAE